jgi:hypothetical protein
MGGFYNNFFLEIFKDDYYDYSCYSILQENQ